MSDNIAVDIAVAAAVAQAAIDAERRRQDNLRLVDAFERRRGPRTPAERLDYADAVNELWQRQAENDHSALAVLLGVLALFGTVAWFVFRPEEPVHSLVGAALLTLLILLALAIVASILYVIYRSAGKLWGTLILAALVAAIAAFWWFKVYVPEHPAADLDPLSHPYFRFNP